MKHLISRDRVTPISQDTRGLKRKRLQPEVMGCRYCGDELSLDSEKDKRHILEHCGALNRFTAPVSAVNLNINLLAKRLAGATKVRRCEWSIPKDRSGVT